MILGDQISVPTRSCQTSKRYLYYFRTLLLLPFTAETFDALPKLI